LNGVGTLDSQDPDVRQRQAGRLLAGAPHPAGEFLEAKKIPFWKSLRQRDEKRPVAASDIDLERRRTCEDLRQIERREIVRWNQFDFGCSRCGAGIFLCHLASG
jgi:ribosomal protein S27AE